MILRTFCPFFVFLFVKYLCLPERRFVIGYIYKKEDCDCRYGDLDYDSDCELDGRFANDYADEIKAMFDAYTASDDTDMAEYFDGSNSAVAKIKSLKWDFESFDGVLFGRVRATLTEPLTEDEEAELKEFITGQNSDGLGEGAEQQDIRIPDGIMNVHFWNSGDSYFVRNSDEFSEMPHTHGMTMGGM